MRYYSVLPVLLSLLIVSCGRSSESKKEEQIAVTANDEENADATADTTINSVIVNASFNQIMTVPNAVIETGLADHKLVTIYKSRAEKQNDEHFRFSKSSYDDNVNNDNVAHFMPGIDILYGYNLLNIAHYDLHSRKLNYFFKSPALIKTLYYPAFETDSVDHKAIVRNFYLVSAYDEDTNKDSVINRKDLRRFYHFDSTSTFKTLVIPANYHVIRSQYDYKSDLMYIYASLDENKNGTRDKKEKIHIFWLDLKNPGKAVRLF